MLLDVASRERAVHRGTRRGERLVREFGDELREARLASGLTQAAVAHAVGCSWSEITRIERGARPTLSLMSAARLMSVLGRELTVRSYPAGPPIRDAAHVSLLRRLKERVSPQLRWRLEVPVADSGDARAFDAVLEARGVRIAIEAETRVRDVQALLRRVQLKLRDGRVDRLVVVVRATRANRAAIEVAAPLLRDALPAGSRACLRALAHAEDPGANGLLFV